MQVYKDGVVSYKLSVKVVHDGYLVVGDKVSGNCFRSGTRDMTLMDV